MLQRPVRTTGAPTENAAVDKWGRNAKMASEASPLPSRKPGDEATDPRALLGEGCANARRTVETVTTPSMSEEHDGNRNDLQLNVAEALDLSTWCERRSPCGCG